MCDEDKAVFAADGKTFYTPQWPEDIDSDKNIISMASDNGKYFVTVTYDENADAGKYSMYIWNKNHCVSVSSDDYKKEIYYISDEGMVVYSAIDVLDDLGSTAGAKLLVSNIKDTKKDGMVPVTEVVESRLNKAYVYSDKSIIVCLNTEGTLYTYNFEKKDKPETVDDAVTQLWAQSDIVKDVYTGNADILNRLSDADTFVYATAAGAYYYDCGDNTSFKIDNKPDADADYIYDKDDSVIYKITGSNIKSALVADRKTGEFNSIDSMTRDKNYIYFAGDKQIVYVNSENILKSVQNNKINEIADNVLSGSLSKVYNKSKAITYITKKVADRLNFIFKENRKEFEEKWDDLKIFINYGMLSQEDFYERAKDFALLKDVEGKYFTFEEYKTLIKDNQTDKDGNLVYLYANNKEEQYSYIEAAKQKGYSVLLMEGQLDTPMVNMLEQKLEKSRFTRVDADIIDRLIVKEDAKKTDLSKEQSDNLTEVFRSQMPQLDKTEFFVEIQALGEQNQPVLITQNEYMRRMKAMSQFQAGMNFYGQMPDSYNIVLNSDHALVKKVLEDAEANTAETLKPILAEIKGQEARLAVLHQEQNKKKPEEITQQEKDDVHNTEKAISDEKAKRNEIISGYAKNNNIVHQLIDLALLQNGMLKGASLDAFLKRSVDMIK